MAHSGQPFNTILIHPRAGYFYQFREWMREFIAMAARYHVHDEMDFVEGAALLIEHAEALYQKGKYKEQELPLAELRLTVRRWFGEAVRDERRQLDLIYGECVAAAQVALGSGTKAAAQAAADVARRHKAPPHFVGYAVRHAVTLQSNPPSAA
jgi:hypothetical protein